MSSVRMAISAARGLVPNCIFAARDVSMHDVWVQSPLGRSAMYAGVYLASMSSSSRSAGPSVAQDAGVERSAAESDSKHDAQDLAGSSYQCKGPTASGAEEVVVYTGQFAKAHKRLKWASLANSFAAAAATPAILSYSEASPMANGLAAASLLGLALLTTGGLHWFTSPYVHELRFYPTTQHVHVTTINLLGRERSQAFHIDEVTHPRGFRPLATFAVGRRTYYLDGKCFPDTELLERLSPIDPQLAMQVAAMQQDSLQQHDTTSMEKRE